ncbi:MAG: hypothetical protein HUU49_04025 [Candidatus Buchananbacteria bacterium]|nr:hypothetical protein [Candidatus Buchananbacteria bacterium]
MKKYLLTILILTTLVLTGCLSKPQTNQNTSVVPEESEVENENVNTATTTEEIDTSDWKTYRNEEYGFEFKYPENWKIFLLDDNRISLAPNNKEVGIPDKFGFKYFGDIFITIYKNENLLDLENYYNSQTINLFNERTPETVMLGKLKVSKFIDFPGIIETDIYVFRIKDLVIEITAFNKIDENINIIERLITTI